MNEGRAYPFAEGTVRLSGGRKLGYAEFGDPEGDPVLWFHGTPGARLQIPPEVEPEGMSRRFRIVTVERPGNGASTKHLYSHLIEWPPDVAEFADALSIDRFAVVGLSGGGPYVLACAHEMPGRIPVAIVLGGLGPVKGLDAPDSYTRILGYLEPVLMAARGALGAGLEYALRGLAPIGHQALWAYMKFGPPPDRPIFRRAEMKEMFMDDILGGIHGGMRGPIFDLALFSTDWGFSLRDIDVPVRFWQGDADLIVPFNHGETQASLVKDGKLFIRPGEGHFAGFAAIDTVLDEIEKVWTDRSRAATVSS